MNAVNPIRAATAFALLFVLPFLVLFGLIGLTIGIYSFLGSLGFTTSRNFLPLWLTLPLLVISPVACIVGSAFVLSPFFALSGSLFYIGSVTLIRSNAPRIFLLVVGVPTGFLVGSSAHFLVGGSYSSWLLFPLIGACDGLLAAAALTIWPKYFLQSPLRA